MKNVLKVLLRVLIILVVVVCLVAAIGFGYFYYTRWAKEQDELITYSGDKIVSIVSKKTELEPTVTGLCLGVNDGLTDFIMLCKYDPNTRQAFLMSIPRDTKFDDTDRKINSVYAWYGGKPEKTVEAVEKLTDVKIDYYVLFKTKLLREIVDEIDGVVIDVPINMNYDDPYQNLHIHLNKGIQKLNGDQAEQFVRFRKNNNNTGYVRGDEDRIQAQQTFIRAMISRCLEPQNILKAKRLIEIAVENTKTNIPIEILDDFIDDAVAFKTDRIRMETLPGEGGYASNGQSYFFVNKAKAEELIDEMFLHELTLDEVNQMLLAEANASGDESGEEPQVPIRTEFDKSNITVEVLSATSSNYFSEVVKMLKEAGYKVVRVGNLSEKPNLSSVKTHVSSTEAIEAMQEIAKLVGINKMETDYSNSEVDFTVILGSKYSL